MTDNTTLADTLARPRTATLAGKEHSVPVLNFNHLADLEEHFGALEDIDIGKISHQRYVLWFILSRSQPELTEQQIGESLTLDNGAETGAFIRKVFTLSGFKSYDEPEGVPKGPNDAEPVGEQPIGSENSPSGASSPATSRRKK